MRKLAVMVVAVLFIAGMSGICYAAGLGPVEPLGAKKCDIGVEYNAIIDRDLDTSGGVKKGNDVESSQAYAKMIFGVGDYFNVYGKLGAADFEEKITWKSDYDNRSQTLDYGSGRLWGVGGNGLYDFGNNVGVGGDVQFDMWFNEIDSVTATNVTAFSDAGSLKNYEFQASLYTTYTFTPAEDFKFIPYAGGYYSYFKSAVGDAIKYADTMYNYTLVDLEGEDSFGLLVGANVAALKNFSLNIEGRFIAETAVTAGLSYRF